MLQHGVVVIMAVETPITGIEYQAKVVMQGQRISQPLQEL